MLISAALFFPLDSRRELWECFCLFSEARGDQWTQEKANSLQLNEGYNHEQANKINPPHFISVYLSSISLPLLPLCRRCYLLFIVLASRLLLLSI
jgi:hypothetical protein